MRGVTDFLCDTTHGMSLVLPPAPSDGSLHRLVHIQQPDGCDPSCRPRDALPCTVLQTFQQLFAVHTSCNLAVASAHLACVRVA